MLPVRARHIPNILSVARIFLVLPVVQALLSRDFHHALIWFTIAGLSDGIDGFLARTCGWQSRLGSYLDPIADKLLLASSYLCLAWMDLIPGWLAWLVVARDVIIFAGGTAYYFLLQPFEGQPSLISKLNTLLQLLLVVMILIEPQFLAIPPFAIQAMSWMVALTTALSGLLYVKSWGSRYCRERRSGN